MSVEAAPHETHARALPEPVAHHFDDADQQHEAAILGMWSFLATEVLFFGGLFLAYAVYRALATIQVTLASHHLSVALGGFNTAVLLCSSLSMALAVREAQLGNAKRVVQRLIITMILGAAFLGVKAVEYTTDYHERLIPGLGFQIPAEDIETMTKLGVDPARFPMFQMFFVLYFFMTGLHAIHLIVGIVLVGIIAALSWRKRLTGGYANMVEVIGLYWHFIDIVWVFLYPLLYLIDPHLRS